MHANYRTPRGSAMVLGFIMVLMLLALAMAFASRLSSNHLRMESDIAGERCYELAQTANTVKIMQVWNDFKAQSFSERVAWLGGEDLNGNGVLDPGEDIIKNGVLDPEHASGYQDSGWNQNGPGFICTRVKPLSMLKNRWVLVRFTTWARMSDDLRGFDVIRKVQRVVRFAMTPASIFDFVYFATNYGAIDGSRATMYGPIGSNGDMSITNRPTVTGRIFAAQNPETGSVGAIQGNSSRLSLSAYKNLMKTNPLLRPTNPVAPPEDKNRNGTLDPGEDTNGNGVLDDFAYELGYDGTQPVQKYQPPAVMPLLGDLGIFKGYAASFTRPKRTDLAEPGGTTGAIVKQLKSPGLDPTIAANYVTLIDQTYGDHGEVGMKALVATDGSVTYAPLKNKIESDPTLGWKNGNVALVGTPAQPLVVLGPVVVTNDLVIKGTITGQGTFFVGRNIHVIGDLAYKDPPQWKPDDIYFDQTAALNRTKDAIGFGARGNIMLGDYTSMDTNADQWNVARTLMTPPFTKTQRVDNQDDQEIGYGNGNSQGNGRPTGPLGQLKPLPPTGLFPGDYTVVDGDKYYLDDESVPLTPNRAFYQSTFPKKYVNSISVKPKVMQGVFYSGHLFAGRADNLQLFGSLIAHDEGILSDNGATFIYDARISQVEPSTYINLFLPHDAALDVVYWKDSGIDDAMPGSPDW